MTVSRKIKLGKSPAYLRFLNWGLMGTAGAFMVNQYLLHDPRAPAVPQRPDAVCHWDRRGFVPGRSGRDGLCVFRFVSTHPHRHF